jgi:hypothetical protein
MSLYTRLTVTFPGFLRTRLGHWLFWAVIAFDRHIVTMRKAFEDAAK